MKLTPTHRRFFDLLKDGMPHDRSELIALLDDEFNEQPEAVFYVHVSNLRKRLMPAGYDVVVRETSVRLVRLISAGSGIPAL